MNKIAILLVTFTVQICFISCSKDSSVEVLLLEATYLDVAYGTNPQQKYDLYLPAGRTPDKTKVIVLVHGGGWTEGDKSDMEFILPYIKTRHPDHAILNVNYVLADANTAAFPNQFLDLEKALKKLTSDKNNLRVLPEFGLIGTSAGAHIAMMYAYKYDIQKDVKFIADIVGPTDFTDPFYSDNPTFPYLLNFLVDESAYPINTNFPEILSPVYHINNQSSPSLLFYGSADPLIPLSNGQNLSTILSDAGVDHNFTIYDGGHGNWSQSNMEDMIYQISGYVDTYLSISE